MERAEPQPTGGELVIDATDLGFIDHRHLDALAEYARQTNATAVLQASWPGSVRLIEILHLPDVRVELQK